MVIIEEIEINNCFSISQLLLRFENKHFVSIFNCSNSHKLKDKLILAIQPFLLKDFIATPLEIDPNRAKSPSNVRIKFIIPKGKFENNISVEAMRTSDSPDTIYYYFDGEQYIDNIRVYHERCRIDVTSLFPCLNKVFSNENKNLMSIWINNEYPELRATGEKSYELLANFLQVSHLRSNAEIRNIEKLSHSMLTIQRHTKRLERRTFVDVANNIGKIFKYITFEKYDVQFSIPLAEQNIQMDQLKWEDMDLSRAETYILNINEKTSALWNTIEPGLKYLLKIAQQIALAENLGQHCIIIKDTSLLQNYQNQEMIKEAIIEDDGINKEANWKNKNFLNQIINVCNEMEIMLFINYHGGLPLPPENANIIKCRKSTENDNSDSIYVLESLKSMNLQEFIELVVPPNTRNEAPAV